ncbi:MAG: hypothetical protein ABRQ27_03680 [Clostridiaceae bacterium]
MKKIVKLILAVFIAIAVISAVSFGVYKNFFNNDKPEVVSNDIPDSSATNVNTESSANTENAENAENTQKTEGNSSSDTKVPESSSKSTGEPEVVVTPETVQKSTNGQVEDTIISFKVTFKNLVNNTNMDTSYLKDIVQSDTQVYNNITAIITDYRKKGIKIDDLEFTMDKVVQVEDNIYEVVTAAKETQTVGGQTKTLTKKVIFDVKVTSSGNKITGCSGLSTN